MKKLRVLLAIAAFVISLYLIIKGQRIPNKSGLLMMFVGLGGLLLNLYFYNKQHAS